MAITRTAASAVLLVFSFVGSADAAVRLVPGSKLLLSQKSGRERLVYVGKSPLIVHPPTQSGGDPTQVGATLRIVNPGSGETASFDLPAAQWSTKNGTTYKFKNSAAPAGPSEVKVGLLRDGSIKVTAQATGISLDEPTQGSIGIVFIVGGTAYCALFGGDVQSDVPNSFRASKAPAPAECPDGSRAGTSVDVNLPSNVDGENIAFTVHEPAVFIPGVEYPLILEGHGYGGNRVAAAERPTPNSSTLVARLLGADYGVISIDQRGHGDSGGQIRILDPDFEGKDLVQILDWAEANIDWLAYRDANLLLGAIGQSYGGGFQHTILAHDPLKRLDAIAPEITWYDLRYSLFSGMAFKTFWATFLSVVGNATPGGQDPEVNAGLVNGLTNNSLTQEQLDLLKKSSPITACEAGTLDPIDALYWQSSSDTLFNLNDAAHNFACLDALGGDVRLLTKNSGHDSLVPGLGGAIGEQCGNLKKDQAIVDWYDEKLKGEVGKASYIPKHCFHIDGSTNDAVVTQTLPVGGDAFNVAETLVVAQDGSPQVASIPLTTIGPEGAVVAGIPTIQLQVSDPLGMEAGDPILFLGLARRPAGSLIDTLIQRNQVRPFRGYGVFDDELVGGTARLAAGDELRLLIHASFASRYSGSGSDVAVPVNVEAVVGVPLLPADLPAPPPN